MYKICKTEQSAARQKKIEQNLLQAMLSHDYEDISISDLCEQMQIPRKSFYRYFSGKDGALFALLDHTLLEFTQIVPKNRICGTVIDDLETFFRFWYKHQILLKALCRGRLCGVLIDRAIEHGVREKMMPKDLLEKSADEQRMAMTFLISGLLSMVVRWHSLGYRENPQEMAKFAVNVLTMQLSSVGYRNLPH